MHTNNELSLILTVNDSIDGPKAHFTAWRTCAQSLTISNCVVSERADKSAPLLEKKE